VICSWLSSLLLLRWGPVRQLLLLRVLLDRLLHLWLIRVFLHSLGRIATHIVEVVSYVRRAVIVTNFVVVLLALNYTGIWSTPEALQPRCAVIITLKPPHSILVAHGVNEEIFVLVLVIYHVSLCSYTSCPLRCTVSTTRRWHGR
jgi:hypothetical protein